MTDWKAVTNAAGDVLGWMAAPDPDEPDVDWWEADRVPKAGRLAAVLDEAAGLFADDVFDPGETWDQGLAAGLSDANLDSAAYVGLTLWKIEHHVTD